jgi:hypothetical protein
VIGRRIDRTTARGRHKRTTTIRDQPLAVCRGDGRLRHQPPSVARFRRVVPDHTSMIVTERPSEFDIAKHRRLARAASGEILMVTALRSLDRIIRGEATSLPALRRADFDVPIWGLCVVIDVLGLGYGLCMGVFSMTGGNHQPMQIVATMLKVPALFLLTLLVTLPSLYVFNAMVGSRLAFRAMLRLLVASLAVMLAVLSSIGPIVGFFSFTTTNYPFMVILNVVVYAVAGCLGLAFLLQTLHRLSLVQTPAAVVISSGDEIAADSTAPASTGPLDPSGDHVLGRHVRTVFRIWVIVFGLVGAQMAWVLRPFIGHPNQAFTWFRPTGSNFFECVASSLKALFN